MIISKSSREFELMRQAGKVVAKVFDALEGMCVPGMSTYELNKKAEEVIFENGCLAPCKGYYGYPAGICISVNEVLIHGIPSKKIILKEGDIVSLDVVASYKGYCADATRTFGVGEISPRAKRLVDTAKEAFYEGISHIKVGAPLGDVCGSIQEYVESKGYGVARDYTGHGIGANMHEDPNVPNYGKKGTGVILPDNIALAVEPMITEGNPRTRVLPDEWTVVTRDGKLSAHYENTVILEDGKLEIITLRESEKN